MSRMLLTGWSLHLPGVDLTTGGARGGWARTGAVPPEKAAAVLGRKGLLYKEPSTRLALCAVHRALGFEPGRRPDGRIDPATAVIACSNLGNVETVARVARTVEEEGGRAVSVLDAPNVSSNVLAGTVALWFGFGGPNLMLCSGGTSGTAGLRMASLLLRAGRADRVVLVGAEPCDEVATLLHGGALNGSALNGSTPRGGALRAGAACAVLTGLRPDVPVGDGEALVDFRRGRRPAVTVGPGGFDVIADWGDFYGAHGVVELALAAHLAVDEGHGTVGTGTVSVISADGGRGR